MSELIRSTMKKNKMHANLGAFVLSNETVFIKNVSMPEMTVDQLEYNLPFEFNDYITGELKEFAFDYAVVTDDSEETKSADGEEEGEQATPTIELMAVGALKSVLEDARETMRKSGLRLVMTAPAVSAYIALIRAQSDTLSKDTEEYGILDLGSESIRMYMFKRDKHIATRVLEIGISSVDGVLADAYGVDVHLAHTYLLTNYENCQQREECIGAYENIAVELMRSLNFYRFSNPNSSLSDLWLCGGGAAIQPLAETIAEMLDMRLHTASELVPGGDGIENCNSYVQAIGIAMA